MYKLLQGILLGIGVGILIAPDKGSETRRKLMNGFNDYKDDAEYYLLDATDKVKSKAKDISGTVKSKASDFADSAKSKANNIAGNLKSTAKDFKHDVEED